MPALLLKQIIHYSSRRPSDVGRRGNEVKPLTLERGSCIFARWRFFFDFSFCAKMVPLPRRASAYIHRKDTDHFYQDQPAIMKSSLLLIAVPVLFLSCHLSQASQADDTTIVINAKNAGPTPFINQLTLLASSTDVIRSIQFAIAPKPGSHTRTLSATYSNAYLTSRGYIQPSSAEVFLPVFGLYSGYTNTVTLTYTFIDGSSKSAHTTITTSAYDDPCNYGKPTVLEARTDSEDLSYDFIMIRERCDNFAPTIIDTDSAVRWVGTAGIANITSLFFDNAVYQASGHALSRIDLDGTVTLLHDYADIGVTYLHHNIDRGKTGLILDADTSAYFESTNIEVDAAGNVLKTWDLAKIVSAAMVAGGDDPSQFVYPSPQDWFHNNSVAYNRADDSIIISSRENFVICLDYETGTIKWILGDPTKKWYQFPSLRQYALTLADGTTPPEGQHAVSIASDQNLLLFDNGSNSALQKPPGTGHSYSSPRKYQLDLHSRVATEVWSHPLDQPIFSQLCSSVYEDAPSNYLVDYAFVYDPASGTRHAQILGLTAAGEMVFHYEYPNVVAFCDIAYNSIPLHLEDIRFPTVGPMTLNVSTRGLVTNDDTTLIGGFIVAGNESQLVAVRALGPSLDDSGVSGTVANPSLILLNSSGTVIATNDDWASDSAAAAELTAEGLAPGNPKEAATQLLLDPGAYTVVLRSADGTPGIGLVEAYDVSPTAASKLANLSTRGFVGTDGAVLIGGFIVGEVANSSLIVRALGPSLSRFGLSNVLANPTLTIFDQDGTAIASNEDWQDDVYSPDIQKNGLAPTNELESALSLFLPAGNYSAIVQGSDGGTGVGLVEIYDIAP